MTKDFVFNLHLRAQPFKEILEGIKTEEFRDASNHNLRQANTALDHLDKDDRVIIKFINGYGNDRPWLTMECVEIEFEGKDIDERVIEIEDAPNEIEIQDGDTIVYVLSGQIINSGNLEKLANK